ncbi:MAG: UDP-2,4-diacetamido-2,4,6-trideoxy-beta-L-altropyranose hydrolase [Verrucomicrobiota bacterium]
MKSVIIRADGGGMIGTGHIMRMLALAQAIRRKGQNVVFATVACPPKLVERLESANLNHRRLKVESVGSTSDAESTMDLIEELEAPWVVLDGYHFGVDYQNRLAKTDAQVLCVDDHLHGNEWNCDAILNQNLDAEIWAHYSSQNPNTQMLLGSSFCLLREEFLKDKPSKKGWQKIEKLLITLGGSDPENASLKVLNLLEQTDSPFIQIRLIIGPDNLNTETLRAFKTRHEIDLLSDIHDMPAQYQWADGIISAGGSTCWEWLHHNLPGAIITIADNQEPIVEAICSSHKSALSLGWFNKIEHRKSELQNWLENPRDVINEAYTSTLIDGFGADRVASLLTGQLRIHFLTQKDGWMSHRLRELIEQSNLSQHSPEIYYDTQDLPRGDLLFILSYWGLVDSRTLAKHSHNLVVHESDLPKGKGWSPLTWQIIEGKNSIPFTLFEAIEKVDAGDIYAQTELALNGNELLDELHELQVKETIKLCEHFVDKYPAVVTQKRPQKGRDSFYERRTPASSELDPTCSIEKQFDLLRTVDNQLYPAFFFHRGTKYILRINRADND